MNRVDERGDVYIDVHADNIDPKMLKKYFDISGVKPDPVTGTILINISSYIRYIVGRTHER